MLQIYLRENRFRNRKKKFCFFSKNSGIITKEEFIREIADFNSSATEADARLIMNIMETLFNRFITQGKAVQLPMGTFQAYASGTTDTAKTPFTPAKQETDHTVTLHFTPNTATAKLVKETTACERIKGDVIRIPHINRIENESAVITDTFRQGEILTVYGTFLKSDLTDPSMGIFLTSRDSGIEYRLTRYFANSYGRICAFIGTDIPCGTYTLTAVSKPDMTRLTAGAPEVVRIIEAVQP